ncbi:MAG: hypothetical protein Kow0027_27530 [Saprospiraceae bacterium]
MMLNEHTIKVLKRVGLITGAGLLMLLITAAINRKLAMPVLATEVVVNPLEGNVFLIDSTDVVSIINKSWGESLDGLPAGNIDPDRIERFLEEDAFVKNAEVAITANSKVKVIVTQRQPVLRVIDNEGVQYYLDETGSRVPLSKHFTARTLVATGNIPHFTSDFQLRKKHLLKDLFELTQTILADPLWSAMFEQVYVNRRNEFLLVPKVGDQLVILGGVDNLEQKLRRLRIFYQEALSHEGWQKYSTIDLRFKGQVVCERN